MMMAKNKQTLHFNLRNLGAPRNLVVLSWSTGEFETIEGMNLLRVKASILSNKLLKENVMVTKGGGYRWVEEPAGIIAAPVIEEPKVEPVPVEGPGEPAEKTHKEENFFDDDFEDGLEEEKTEERKVVEPTKSDHLEEGNFFDDSFKEGKQPVTEVKEEKSVEYEQREVEASKKIQVGWGLWSEDVQRQARPATYQRQEIGHR